MDQRIVLAYSGGLDTSVCILWLKEKFNADVISVTLDVGQQEDLKEIGRRAKAIGVAKHYFINAKDEFVKEYIAPSIRANGMYQGEYPLGTALARPLIATKLVEIAEKEGASSVAHGSTGKGNDQVRFDVTMRSLNPKLKIIAPVREWNMTRDQEIKYAKERRIPIKESKSVFSTDENLWGRSIESGPLEDPAVEPPSEALQWVTSPKKAPDEPAYVVVGFENGVPSTLQGKEMTLRQIIQDLNALAGAHGVGLIDHIEDRLVGIKSREVYEAPAAVCTIAAHRDLEKLVLSRHELAFKGLIEQQWAWLVYSGLWVEPLRKDLDAFIAATQGRVNGKVRLKLYKGGLRVVGRSSKYSLYDYSLATYDSTSTYDQQSAVGFVNIWGMTSQISYLAAKRASKEQKGE